MKMSNKSYQMLTDFYNMTVEQANDNDVKFILRSIHQAAESKRQELSGIPKEEINYGNPNLSKHNAKVIRDFFEDFLAKGNDDEAIYLIEGLKSLVKYMVDKPKDVAEFVIRKKAEARNNPQKHFKDN